jgi:hypothetical protein
MMYGAGHDVTNDTEPFRFMVQPLFGFDAMEVWPCPDRFSIDNICKWHEEHFMVKDS